MRHPLLLGLCMAVAALPAAAADTENGKTLHDANCVSCHAAMTNNEPENLYTREDRRVNDLNALQNQVQRCALNLKLDWFDSELEDVAAYLDVTYYKFTSAAEDEEKETPEKSK